MNNRHNDDNLNTKAQGADISADVNDEIEYIMPVAKKKKKHRHSKHKHFASSTPQSQKELEMESADYVFMKPYSKKEKCKRRAIKAFGIVMSVIAALLVIAVSTIFIFNQVGKSAMHNYDDMSITPSPELENVNEVKEQGKIITYNDKTYAFNDKVTSVVLLGVDTALDANAQMLGTGGQADAIYIAVIDTSNDKVTILGVSRDTMVDVNVYNKDGGFVNTENMQICLSYAYGDGKHTSCENTITSLERLFYGMQFKSYFSFNTDAIMTLNDAIGGVTVTTDIEFDSKYYDNTTYYPGDTITLHGLDTLRYIQVRDVDQLDSNNARMNRQREYMTAFLKQTWPAVKSDVSIVLDLNDAIASNSSTNLTTSKMTYLATTVLQSLDSYSEIEFVNVPGTVSKGEYAEFYVDEDALMQIMLDLFYVQIS